MSILNVVVFVNMRKNFHLHETKGGTPSFYVYDLSMVVQFSKQPLSGFTD